VRSAAGGRGEDKRLQDLQNQVSSIQSVQAADSARLAADMDAERTKVAALQDNHLALSRELAQARTQELSQRRELLNANDEIESLRKKHTREVMDMEMDLKKRDREIRELKEDLRMVREDLDRERDVVGQLKSTITQQSTTQLTLTTQNNALQAQVHTLQSSSDCSAEAVSKLRHDLDRAQKRVAELEQEAREAEMIRRRLHNLVQELKGNIRVFCRVRPLLPSEVPPDAEDREKAVADILFPDKRDHKEIVLNASSESATGQERKETWSFEFDRVGFRLLRLSIASY